MPVPEVIRREAELLLLAYCLQATPENIRDRYRLAFRTRGESITLYESFGPWNPAFPKDSRKPVAKFHYLAAKPAWALYWADDKLKWHLYDKLDPTLELTRLIEEVHTDPNGVFFG